MRVKILYNLEKSVTKYYLITLDGFITRNREHTYYHILLHIIYIIVISKLIISKHLNMFVKLHLFF